MNQKFKIIILIVVLLVQINSCSEENGGNQDQPLITIDDFGPELRSSLSVIKTQAPAKDAFDSGEESYSSAKEPGGTFQRVLGDNDPLSIFFVVDLIDDIIRYSPYPHLNSHTLQIQHSSYAHIALPLLNS